MRGAVRQACGEEVETWDATTRPARVSVAREPQTLGRACSSFARPVEASARPRCTDQHVHVAHELDEGRIGAVLVAAERWADVPHVAPIPHGRHIGMRHPDAADPDPAVAR